MQATTLSPEHQKLLEQLRSSGIKPPQAVVSARKTARLNVIEFGEQYYYIPETSKPIHWEEWQKIILKVITSIHNYPTLREFYPTILITGIKKIGKTAITGVIGRHRAEGSVNMDEILFFANDETQSRGRAYAGIEKSITLDPMYDKQKRVLVDKDGNIKWRVIEDYLEHVPTGTKIKAVNVDYRGEAGANPSLTIWTEAWGFDSEKQFLLFQEMTPVLTREHSQRIVESYAGYTGKSKILESIWNKAIKEDQGGRRLTIDDIPDWPWPDEHDLPLYVNDSAGLFAYIDQGPIARTRMPWTQGPEADQYYSDQANQPGMTPEQFDRLHFNYWVSPTEAFIPIEQWYKCADINIQSPKPWRESVFIHEIPDLDAYEEITDSNGRISKVRLIDRYIDSTNWRIVDLGTPLVLGVDASTSGDCTAVVVVGRNSDKYQDAVLHMAYKWDPPRGSKIDYEHTPNSVTGLSLKQQLIDLCLRYNVVQLAYDNWQMHHMMNELRQLELVWCREYSQAGPREVADKQLYDVIMHIRLTYNPNSDKIQLSDVTQHLKNASRQQRAKEDTKLRIVKSNSEAKIDLTIGLSMAVAECLRLDL